MTLLTSDRDQLEAVWRDAAVIDPDTCRMVVHATSCFLPVLVPLDRALLMLRDATKVDVFERLVGVHVDGTYYEFPGAS